MKVVHPLRLAVTAIVGVALATGLGVQSAGIALTGRAPPTALSLFPLNGLAKEELASAVFIAGGIGEGDGASSLASQWALAAYQSEPLTPEAHAILALSEQGVATRSEIVDLASELNRRNPRLQAVVLQGQATEQDYSGAIATLDRILRVRPSQSPDMFPTLLPVFVREGAVDEFARILNGTSPWHEKFFRYAVRQPTALLNLVALRKRVSFHSEELDKILLKNLVREGELEVAYEFYKQLEDEVLPGESAVAVGWNSTYAPFDWDLKDEAGIRAQPSQTSSQLEISVRPGEGGVVARRLIRTPEVPFILEVEHDIKSSHAMKDITIQLYCRNAGTSQILKRSLDSVGSGVEIDNLPKSCSFVELSIEARAWSGRQALNVTIDSIGFRKP